MVAAREQTVSNLSRLLEYAQAQFDAGVVTRTDVAQSQARLAQARTQLVQAQGALAAAVQAYQRLVGASARRICKRRRPPTGLPSDLESALDTAGTNSPVLRSAVADTELADANVDVAASAGRLRVTLEGSQSIGADFDGRFRSSSGDSVGVRVSVPVVPGRRDPLAHARATRAARRPPISISPRRSAACRRA